MTALSKKGKNVELKPGWHTIATATMITAIDPIAVVK